MKFGTYPISTIYIFCPTGSDKNSIYSQFLLIPTMNSTDLFFYPLVATVTDLDFTSADLLGKVDVLHVAQKEGELRNE